MCVMERRVWQRSFFACSMRTQCWYSKMVYPYVAKRKPIILRKMYDNYFKVDEITEEGDKIHIKYHTIWGDKADSLDDITYSGEAMLMESGGKYKLISVENAQFVVG